MSTSNKPIEILLVEDNIGDVRLTQIAFKRGKGLNRLHVVEDGVEALAFLRQEGKYRDMPRPDLVLLDLSGSEVLAEIKADNQLKVIPVVILTTSSASEDILKSYTLQANSYITKPVEWDQFMRAVQAIKEFWFTIAKLPPEEGL